NGSRNRARFVQRRGVRDRAHGAPDRRRDRRAHPGTARDDAVQRRRAGAQGLRSLPVRPVRWTGLCRSRVGYTIEPSGHLDVHLADGLPQDPRGGAVPARPLGGRAASGERPGAGWRDRAPPAAPAPTPPAFEAPAPTPARTPRQPAAPVSGARPYGRGAPAPAAWLRAGARKRRDREAR